MSYCNNKLKAIVNFSFGNGYKETITFDNPPIEVELTKSTDNINNRCWRFSGKGVENNFFYEHFACGKTPEYRQSTGGSGRGVNLYLDGILLMPPSYEYSNGAIDFVGIAQPRNNYISSGNCDNCINVCTIKISNSINQIYEYSGQCPCIFNVACDDDCPPGTTKCFSTNYPGYCCLPCNEIAGEIKAIASQIRRSNNG